MSLALAFAVTLGTAAVLPAQQGSSVVERVREACVETNMQREAFERLYAGRNLTPLIPVIRQGEESKLTEWSSGYDDGGIQIVMDGERIAADPSEATDCGVLTPRPEGNWRADVERLAQELDMRPATSDELPNVREARTWTASGDRPLTLNYEVYREAVVVRFVRPTASSQ